MRRAVYVCQIGCAVECEHGLPCVIYMVDRAHPHPMARGREAHIAFSDDNTVQHEWNGRAGRCRVSDNPYFE